MGRGVGCALLLAVHLRKCPRQGRGVGRRGSESPHDEKPNRVPLACPWWPARFRGHRAKSSFRARVAPGCTRGAACGSGGLFQFGAGFEPDAGRIAWRGRGDAAVWARRDLFPCATSACTSAVQHADGAGHGDRRYDRWGGGVQPGQRGGSARRSVCRNRIGRNCRGAGGAHLQRGAHASVSGRGTPALPASLPATQMWMCSGRVRGKRAEPPLKGMETGQARERRFFCTMAAIMSRKAKQRTR